MKKHLIWIVLLLVFPVLAKAQTAIQSPALPNRTYLGGADNNRVNRPIIGVNGSGDVQVDPDAIGIELGAIVATAPITVNGTTMYFNGITPRFQGPIVDVIFCGDLPNTGSNYMSPASGYAGAPVYDLTGNSYALAGSGCAAEDNTTEATADEIMFVNNAFEILSLYCAVSSSGSTGVTLSIRDDAAETAVSITIPTGETTGAINTVSTTDIAANSTVALRATVGGANLSSEDVWCLAKIMIIP